MARSILRLLGIMLAIAAVMFGLFLTYSTLTSFNPAPQQVVWHSDKPDTLPVNVTLRALSWNIGYAGLGDNMDFFYDDGKKVRDTRERTTENINSIADFLGANKGRDFFLLQEVDYSSRRSYYIYQPEIISKALNYQSSVGFNYDVSFVPVPLKNPMGSVKSGVNTFSRPTPQVSTRYQYPGEFPWPSRIFNLRRCMLVNRYPTGNGSTLVLINTHNSAFDDGALKEREMRFLKAFAMEEYLNGNYVVAGGDWNQSPPGFSLSTFGSNYQVPFFRLTNIDENFMPKGWLWAYDATYPTNRYVNQPYTPGKSYTGILDFFLLSPNVKLVQCKTANLEFKNSDHNPVLLSFELIDKTQ
ncbi:MAG: endonuclease/exonuclease/phosphatase family protein [Bacteroidales bacterium]